MIDMRKNLELTGFNGEKLSNEERVQPQSTGVGEKTTAQGTPVERAEKHQPNYQGATNDRTQLGAIACLNLLCKKALPSFPTSDRSAPSTFVVVYPTVSGFVGGTMPLIPMNFHKDEWKLIVSIAKEYEDSAFIGSLLHRKNYRSAVEHLEMEIASVYKDNGLIP